MKPALIAGAVLALVATFALLAATSAPPADPSGIAPRGTFGGCPDGYVDHPTDPAQCVVPALAQRYTDARARIAAPGLAGAPSSVDPWEARRQANAAAAAREDATRQAIETAQREQAAREAADTTQDY